jgi:hypothetical protein
LVGDCGHTKVTRAKKTKKTKKREWHWDEIHQIAFENVKSYYCKRCSTGLPRLFARNWDVHWHLISTTWCSHNSG